MANDWVEPPQSKSEVNRAGMRLADGQSAKADVDLVNQWRSAHAYPQNAVQVGLRHQAAKTSKSALVAQRLKRFPSVLDKLRREPVMDLSRMQDIGGCRAVVSTTRQAYSLLSNIQQSVESGRTAYAIKGEVRDYIAKPKATGYRSIHVVTRYSAKSGQGQAFDGLLVEMQLRSRLQHVWATAVETVDVMRRTSLKAGTGPSDWIEFFRLTASAFAMLERQPLVSGTPTDWDELKDDIVELDENLEARRLLRSYARLVSYTSTSPLFGQKSYMLMDFDVEAETVKVTPFRLLDQPQAFDEYSRLEESTAGNPTRDVVLVAADSLKSLRRAYPNYFADATAFVRQLNAFLKRNPRHGFTSGPISRQHAGQE